MGFSRTDAKSDLLSGTKSGKKKKAKKTAIIKSSKDEEWTGFDS